MSVSSVLPPHFIEFDHALGLDRRLSNCRGASGAVDLFWQVRDSVRELVTAPVVILPPIKEGEPIPDALLHNEVLIVSDRLREAIEPWLKDYEFLPARVELWDEQTSTPCGGGNQVDGFWWLNSWRRLDIVDWDNTEAWRRGPIREDSNYRHSPLKASLWQRLVLRHPVPPDEHFFGLAFFEGEHRYLSPALHAHLVSQNLRIRFRHKLFQKGSMKEGDSTAFEQLLNQVPRPRIGEC